MYTRRAGGGATLSYSYQLIQYLSMEVCTVGGGHGAGEGLQALLPTFASAASVLFNSGRAAVISPVGEQGQAWGVKEILKTTHSSHQNKSGRIKGTQKMSFFAEGGGRRGGSEGGRGPLLSEPDRCSRRRTQEGTARLCVMPH